MSGQLNKAKRSLLREAKTFMDATFTGGSELAHRVRGLVKAAYVCLANLNIKDAASKLVEAYALLKDTELDNEKTADFELALRALDIGLFLFEFARSDEELREIAWQIWDNKSYFWCGLYDAIVSARLYLSFVRDGIKHEVAIGEVTLQNQNPKLKEILESYASKTQGSGNTGGDS
jgi:hypothetical protein